MEENEGQAGSENLETQSSQEVTEQPGQTEGGDAPQVVDLDTVPKFKFAGREWTPKDFQGAYMMQSDYTRKTQALAEERKYYDNLEADLRNVKKNPTLAEQFKSVYPEKFHRFLDHVIAQQEQQQEATQGQQQANAQPQIDPALKQRLEKVDEVYSDLQERRIQASEAQIDAVFKKLGPKYPMADEESVIAKAQHFIDAKKKEDPKAKITDQDWDNLFKANHDHHKKRMETYYSEQVQKQKQANSKGRDMGSGGATAGQAPKLPRSIREASSHALQELEQN